MQKINPYLSLALKKIPLLLSLEDRKPLSITYGCFDRNYWGWKFTDFAGSRFQEGVCSLALFYSFDFEGNYLFKNKRALKWILAGMEYWAGLQHGNGSFDEAYPNEQSFAATAFTAFYVGEAFLALPDEIPAALKMKLLGTFSRAGDWLRKNEEQHGILSNHLAAAAAALYNVYLVTGEEEFKERCGYFLHKIYAHQSSEGWFEEYGGADPGYQTLCSFFLARLWQRTKNDALLGKLQAATEFLSSFVHPDHTIGGEYASRNTEFYFPAAFEMLGEKIAGARAIAMFMRENIEAQDTACLSAMDAYNLFPMLNNYIFAGLNPLPPGDSDKLPFEKKFQKHYKEAGIYINSREKYYSIVGISKGGVVKVFDKAKKSLSYGDCGYWTKSKGGKIFSSQSLERSRGASFNEDSIELSSRFSETTRKIFTPGLFISFRLFTLSLGRLPFFSNLVKCALVKALVLKKRTIDCVLSRKIEFENEQIRVTDIISNLDSANPVFLRGGDKFTSIHMGSGEYFQKNELGAEYLGERNLLKDISDNQQVKFEKVVKF